MLFDPVFTLEQLIAEKANPLLVYQTGQLWGRHFPDKFQEIHNLITNYQLNISVAVQVAKTEGSQIVDRGLTFTANDFQKKNLVGNVLPVKRPDNPFYSGEYKDPIPPVLAPENKFNSIQEAYTHYRVNKPKELIKAMKAQGIKVFSGANEEQILELLNAKVDESLENQQNDQDKSE